MKWATLSDAQRRRWLDWVVATCLLHGTTLYTAYSVAALFGAGLDAETRALRPSQSDDQEPST